MLKKLLAVFLIWVLAFSLIACQKQGEIDNNTQPAKTNGENTPPDVDSYKETIKSYLTIPEDYVVPEYNGRLVAGETPDYNTFQVAWPDGYDPYVIWELPPNKSLKDKMEEYEGQAVWFRVLVDIAISYGLVNENNPNYEKEYLTFVKEETLNFLNAIGAHDLKTKVNSSEGNNVQDFEASLTAEMIDMLSGKCYELLLGQCPRNPEHSSVISDTMSIRLDKMTDSDTVEVIAVCAADKNNRYAEYQKVTVNNSYNSERFKPFTELANITHAEYNKKIDEYLLEITDRNDISEKIVISDDLPKVKKQGTEWRLNKNVTDDDLTEFCVGFNAVLTKAEILKLAEDEEIKVIYLAPQE